MKVPFARPYLTGEEGHAVAEVIASGWVSQGPKVRAFEEALAERVGAADVVVTSSCTTALHLRCMRPAWAPGTR
jgi:perosamine synthetase